MDSNRDQARTLIKKFKDDRYVFGLDCLARLGELTARYGNKAAVVVDGLGQGWAEDVHERVKVYLSAAELKLGDWIPGARPNAPREDVVRIAEAIRAQGPEVVVAVGGGSVIDATKAAVALVALDDKYPNIEDYFGVGKVTEMLRAQQRELLPIVAVQIAAGSGAHLTKYSNITDLKTSQKKLIVDEAVVPPRALFDYSLTTSMPRALTMDGGLDGIAHALEVFFGAKGDAITEVRPPAMLAIELIVSNMKSACENPGDLRAREALGLGTDLGAYCIMIGGTNGAHLTSFSLVDILSHGRACALMNPYYTVLFASAIEDQLHDVGQAFAQAGYLESSITALRGRQLGMAIAESMLALSRDIGFPTTLAEVDGFTDEHIARALAAAKNPQLEMKLKNMPLPLSASMVDEYMAPVLQAAKTGDFALIKDIT